MLALLLLMALWLGAPVIENDVGQPNGTRLDVQPFHASVLGRIPRQPKVIPLLATRYSTQGGDIKRIYEWSDLDSYYGRQQRCDAQVKLNTTLWSIDEIAQ